MRGDRPKAVASAVQEHGFTPHARGSTTPPLSRPRSPSVYPACAGIDRWKLRPKPFWLSLPRMRGDRPGIIDIKPSKKGFTPHARGSTVDVGLGQAQETVYPACAGIDLRASPLRLGGHSLPRMRGDRPWSDFFILFCSLFTPHARGSTQPNIHIPTHTTVYPACAGIDR